MVCYMANNRQWVTLIRDCAALLIPDATPITIPSGTSVQITQMLGGSITVYVGGNLARIEAKDADALQIELSAEDVSYPTSSHIDKTITGPVNMDEVWQQLKTCYDPEIPVNIVDLGLIYHCELEEKAGANLIKVQMTLTAPGCGMGPILARDVEQKLLQVANVTDVYVEMVFEPIWTQDRMSDAARLELGLL